MCWPGFSLATEKAHSVPQLVRRYAAPPAVVTPVASRTQMHAERLRTFQQRTRELIEVRK